MDAYNKKFGEFEVKFWIENEPVATLYRNGRELLTVNEESAASLDDAVQAIFATFAEDK